MKYTEQAIVFNCDGCRLIGIATKPETPAETGVLIVVGGPQYRAGSHVNSHCLRASWQGRASPPCVSTIAAWGIAKEI